MTAIRLSPSGPVIGNTNNGPLDFGPGARLRLTEANSIMGGSLAVPTAPDVIAPDGFGQTDAIVLTLLKPKAELEYRACLALDVENTSTNVGGEIALYLDVSVDGGVTYTNRVKNAHLVAAGILGNASAASASRQCQIWLTQVSGATLGVVTDTTPSIKLRARAQAITGNPGLLVTSTTDPSAGGAGTIHMELEECF